MYVPNYIPEPTEVPRNVTEEPYLVRLAFIRRVALMHFGSLIVVGLLVLAVPKVFDLAAALGLLGACILTLSLTRILWRGKKSEASFASAALPILLVVAALAASAVSPAIWPIWTLYIGVGMALVYTLLCGRDFSFIGQYLLSLIASTVAIAGVANAVPFNHTQAVAALAGNAVYLSYFVYDSASLLARRRLGEELAAVVDLYRDVLNIFGYIVRVIGHWRKHRIWSITH